MTKVTLYRPLVGRKRRALVGTRTFPTQELAIAFCRAVEQLGWIATLSAMAFLLVASPAGAGSETCFLSGEQQAEANKICYYSCPSGPAALTVKAYQLCPLRIHRPS